MVEELCQCKMRELQSALEPKLIPEHSSYNAIPTIYNMTIVTCSIIMAKDRINRVVNHK